MTAARGLGFPQSPIGEHPARKPWRHRRGADRSLVEASVQASVKAASETGLEVVDRQTWTAASDGGADHQIEQVTSTPSRASMSLHNCAVTPVGEFGARGVQVAGGRIEHGRTVEHGRVDEPPLSLGVALRGDQSGFARLRV